MPALLGQQISGWLQKARQAVRKWKFALYILRIVRAWIPWLTAALSATPIHQKRR
jgi:hypothetical protein